MLDKWRRQCGYCGAKDKRLEVDHIVPRSHGGSDRVSNLTLSCEPCNKRKNQRPAAVFLAKKPEVLQKLQRQAKAPLKDAAAFNSTRYALLERLKANGLPVEVARDGRPSSIVLSDRFPRHTGWMPPVSEPVHRKCCSGKRSNLWRSRRWDTGNGRLLARTNTGFPRASPSVNLHIPTGLVILSVQLFQRVLMRALIQHVES